MARRLALAAAFSTLALCATVEARADAFLEKPGAGKVIATITFERAEARASALADYRKFSASAYAEYGLNASTTLLARTEAGHLWGGDGETQASGSIGVRRLLFDAGAFRVVAQGTASAGAGLETGLEGQLPEVRSRGAAFEARIAAVMEFTLGAAPAFVSVSAGPRLSSTVGDGTRADVTFGVRPSAPLLLLAQLFAENDEDRPRAVKAQASAIYDLSAQWSVQAGVFAMISSGAEQRQRGMIVAAIRRF